MTDAAPIIMIRGGQGKLWAALTNCYRAIRTAPRILGRLARRPCKVQQDALSAVNFYALPVFAVQEIWCYFNFWERNIMPRILVVDDEKSALTLYARELLDLGYEILQASGPREALERFRSERPDLVVLDIKMPGMDGLELLGHMLSIDRRIPIVLMSAYSFYRENFLSWAADAYVAKSSDLSEFRRTVKDLLATPKSPQEAPSDPKFRLHGAV